MAVLEIKKKKKILIRNRENSLSPNKLCLSILELKIRILLVINYVLIQFNHIDSNKSRLRMLSQHGKLIGSWVIPKTLYNFIRERKLIKNKKTN